MLVGYARTSTVEQEAGLEAQERDLKAAGCERLFSERVSSLAKRAQLEAVLGFVREGDVLVVTKPDRLARSVSDLLATVSALEGKGVALRVLSMGGSALDTGTPTGRLMLTMLGAVAEFERSLMLERQREGIAKAKADGRYRGRAPTAQAKAAEVHRLKAEGAKPSEIATRLGIGRASVYRLLGSG
ncbi:recombinase family protein [Roseomonas frigidaquae]|uniref:Recombinase family protein n=1 Tax=Falsiroseomonas frigidaquae TaxID=487318 RepID=A0ABX1F5J5_9PROT|nr:recombinase family protein [Falsiroseomonas frigidaquae]NKE47623.1 recombinase family protein [Falsiroseomonas frigidaquae]